MKHNKEKYLKHIIYIYILYTGVSQTVVRGPLGVCTYTAVVHERKLKIRIDKVHCWNSYRWKTNQNRDRLTSVKKPILLFLIFIFYYRVRHHFYYLKGVWQRKCLGNAALYFRYIYIPIIELHGLNHSNNNYTAKLKRANAHTELLS